MLVLGPLLSDLDGLRRCHQLGEHQVDCKRVPLPVQSTYHLPLVAHAVKRGATQELEAEDGPQLQHRHVRHVEIGREHNIGDVEVLADQDGRLQGDWIPPQTVKIQVVRHDVAIPNRKGRQGVADKRQAGVAEWPVRELATIAELDPLGHVAQALLKAGDLVQDLDVKQAFAASHRGLDVIHNGQVIGLEEHGSLQSPADRTTSHSVQEGVAHRRRVDVRLQERVEICLHVGRLQEDAAHYGQDDDQQPHTNEATRASARSSPDKAH
mmetsp:Transcript_37603/g.101761  ORF Transcript_37603/g.101761 Transcript_37603/m.101761 type:complete len:267 (+) Transcript_37603:418-1218(+)